MVIAGEASGDMRAAGLVNALRQSDANLSFSGIGGDCMRKAGVELFADITSLAVIGIVEVIKHFGRIKKVFEQTLAEIDRRKPDAIILVDYPGFNLRLAREIKKRGIKVVYYISPQVWAWREKRVELIKAVVDRMMVLFPFEKDVYAKYGMAVDYVGHPLIDEVVPQHRQDEVLKSIGLSVSKTTIGLMPGSRIKEVSRHLPVMLEAAQQLFDVNHERQFILLKASTISEDLLKQYLRAYKHLPIKVFTGPTYDGINAMNAAMVASGTATLETALLKKPMVVVYKTSWLTYAIAKAVIKIPYIALVNIVAGKKIVQEFIQNNATAHNISTGIEDALHNQQMTEELEQLRQALGEGGASQKAAMVVLDALK